MDRREAAKLALRRTRRERLIYASTIVVSMVITAAIMIAMAAPGTMAFPGGLVLTALEFIGYAVAIVAALVVAFYVVVVVVITMLYAIVWGVAISCSLLDRSKPPKRMEPRCPKCDSAKVFGEPNHRVCTNCGAFQSGDLRCQ